MEKRYACVKVGLLIGLLSFHVLSACVHTRQQFSARESCSSSNQGLVPESPHMASSSSSNPVKAICCLCMTGWGLIGSITLVMGGLIWLSDWGLGYLVNSSNIAYLNRNHHLGVVTRAPFILTDGRLSTMAYYNATPELEAFITKAIKSGQARWNTSNTAAAHFTGNGTQNGSSYLIPKEVSFDGVKDPMVLNNQIMRDLVTYHFSKTRIQYWLNKGLDINARNQQGATMFIGAACTGTKSGIVFLLDNGADVNAQSDDGLTGLLAILLRMRINNERAEAEQVVNLLLKSGADPCKEGRCFKSSSAYVKCLYGQDQPSSIIEKVLEKCNSEHKHSAV